VTAFGRFGLPVRPGHWGASSETGPTWPVFVYSSKEVRLRSGKRND